MWFSTIAVRSVIGRDSSPALSPWSSRSTSSGCRPGTWCCRHSISLGPIPSFLLQSISSCWSVPSSVQPGILHTGEWMVLILCSLAWVLRRSCIMSQRKLARSGGIPGCLQAAQHLVQSVLGLATSTLQGVNCCWPESDTDSMVTKSSVRSLVQSFSLMVITLRGVSSLTLLMMENNYKGS